VARVLITGGTGFLGSYLAGYLGKAGHEVTATYLVDPDPFLRDQAPSTRVVHLDVRDAGEIARVLESARPEVLYHFGAQPFVKPSWEDPPGTFRANLDGSIFLLEWIRRNSPKTKFAFASSSAAYGISPRQPMGEETPFRPLSPYGASKAAVDVICYTYTASFGIPTYRMRIFATTGPGKTGDAPNDFAQQVARLERSPSERVLRVGDLRTRRDFSDVRDAVRAMEAVVERGEPGEAYNLGSGETRTMRSIVDGLVAQARVPLTVEADESRMRRVDESVLQADVSRVRALGWSPQVPWDQTLTAILDHWRAHLPGDPAPASR
jgi:GDP-4-dehydro-6-deoxy-D-mannose reductase